LRPIEVVDAMTKPDRNGTPSLPKRSAPKGLLPSTWLNRSLRLEYVDGFGTGAQASGVLLDFFPFGMVVSIDGVKTCLSWDRLILVQLVEDV
jgi:hypothetical protein